MCYRHFLSHLPAERLQVALSRDPGTKTLAKIRDFLITSNRRPASFTSLASLTSLFESSLHIVEASQGRAKGDRLEIPMPVINFQTMPDYAICRCSFPLMVLGCLT